MWRNEFARVAGVAGAVALLMIGFTAAPASAQPPANWSGFYVGANGGYSFGNSPTSETLTAVFNGFTNTESMNLKPSGLLGGIQAGGNWQSPSTMLFIGGEADFQVTGQKNSGQVVCPPLGAFCNLHNEAGNINFFTATTITTNITQALPWFGTIRGRVGMAFSPSLIAYATGGLAFGNIRTDVTVSGSGPIGYSDSRFKTGWTAGAGVEGALGEHWSVKLEYLYMDLGAGSAGPVMTAETLNTNGTAVTSSFTSSSFTDQIVRAGLNYRFGGP